MSEIVSPPADGTCEVIASARMRSVQPQKVQGVSGVAARGGETHIAINVGRVVIYVEDRAALASLRRAVARADDIADRVFGPVIDEFTLAERRARDAFEKGRRVKP